MPSPPSVLDVHTPNSSFAILHSLTQESLDGLFDKLTRKAHFRDRVGPGWLKYEYNGSVWNLDDESDYTIFSWRQQEQSALSDRSAYPQEGVASTSRTTLPDNNLSVHPKPTLHMHNPAEALPEPPAYSNASYYLFRPSKAHHCDQQQQPAHSPRARSRAGSRQSVGKKLGRHEAEDATIPKLKRDFEKFHSENGVRTVMGSIGPVENVRMLLKAGHRHVYISRKFAIRHGFIPADSAPGNYGYGGLVSIGEWPITLTPSATSPPPRQHTQSLHSVSGTAHAQKHAVGGYVRPDAFFRSSRPPSPPHSHSPYSSPRMGGGGGLVMPPLHATGIGGGGGGGQPSIRSLKSKTSKKEQQRISANEATAPANGLKAVMVQVYLSEEPHFDVVLGRSFFEKRAVKISSVDPTDVWCLDTGEKIECELVILKDGRGEIVTVT